jgi:hypothetical protein
MVIQFIPLAVSPDIPTYGGITNRHSFVITFINGRFRASAKLLGAIKFDGTRIEIGYFRRFTDAVEACEAYARKQLQ